MDHAGPGRGPGDPYQVLGVSADASPRDITRAYRRAVQHAHPDTRPQDPQAAARFGALADAYGLLRDPGRRAAYDRSHPAAEPTGPPPRPGHPAARPRRSTAPFLLRPPAGQLIWAGPVHAEPPATATPTSPHRRGAPAAESGDPVVFLGVPGQLWGWPR